MPTPDIHNLQYGIIYVIGNPKQTHNLRWFATMVEPMIRPLELEWVESWDTDHTIIVARRFNVGNIGKYATVQLHLNQYGRSDSYSLLAAVHAFSDCLQDVMDDSEGDVLINEDDYNDRNEPPKGKWGSTTESLPMKSVVYDIDVDAIQHPTEPQDHTRVEMTPPPKPVKKGCNIEPKETKKKPRRKILGRFRGKNKPLSFDILLDEDRLEREQSITEFLPDSEMPVQELHEDESIGASPEVYDYSSDWEDDSDEVLDIEAEDVLEFRRLESEYERDMKDLRARIVAFIAKYHQDPQQVMTKLLEGKVLLGAMPGHVLVNGDMKIVLPEYDEMEIKMPAMCRALYILFMKERIQGRGIVLKDIDAHRDEIIDIYCLIKPGANEIRVEKTVNNLCDPFSDSLNQMISRVNRCIKNVITDKDLARCYLITGTRGEQYSIDLDPEFMTLPRAVTSA